MFGVAAVYGQAGPSCYVTDMGWCAWVSFFSEILAGRQVCAFYREKDNIASAWYRVSYTPEKGFLFTET
jgi:hypothetical protein